MHDQNSGDSNGSHGVGVIHRRGLSLAFAQLAEKEGLAVVVPGPFSMRMPPQVPPVLKPLRYCEFRVKDMQESEVWTCDTFACAEIEGMAFCVAHGPLIQTALESEGMANGS